MDYKAGLLVLSIVAGCFALPTSKDDMSIFFDQADRKSRIVGGTEAAEGSHPHMAALTNGLMVRSLICGGSVVGRRSVLTAGHCITPVFVSGSLSNSLRVSVGSNRWAGGVLYSVERNVTHPGYNIQIVKNDIGVLITSTDIVLSDRVQIVPLIYDFIPMGVKSRVAGWGRISLGGPLSATLREIDTTTIDGEECVALVAEAAKLFPQVAIPLVEPDQEICTYHSTERANCNQDSGSALTRIDDGAQIGIVSWGFACALGHPDMYVRISYFQSWLTDNIV